MFGHLLFGWIIPSTFMVYWSAGKHSQVTDLQPMYHWPWRLWAIDGYGFYDSPQGGPVNVSSEQQSMRLNRPFDIIDGHVGGKMIQNDAEAQWNDPNELLWCKVDNGFHDVTARPAMPLHHFSSDMAAEWRHCKESIEQQLFMGNFFWPTL